MNQINSMPSGNGKTQNAALGLKIEAESVSFSYQGSCEAALQDLSVQIRPGECVLLCGKSRCGKTTFSRLLNGLSPAFYPGELTGSCSVGELLAGKAAIEGYVPFVGSVFQNPKTQYFNVDTTAELAFPCENSGMESAKIRERLQEVVGQFHLEKLMNRSVFALSGGEKQQVAFAAAYMLKPKLLVLDEPTSNLDSKAIDRLHDMISVMKQAGVTVVLAEHRLAWMSDLADRYLFFEKGTLCADWDAGQFADRHPMSLSGSQKQRVVVAAAMLSDKPLILLDEPTSGLDRENMRQVGLLLQELKAQGKTILVITHDEELAAGC